MVFKNLELLKQKYAYRYEYTNSFERFSEEKIPDKECFYESLKDGTTGDNDKILNGHISEKEYIRCTKIWNRFNIWMIIMIII